MKITKEINESDFDSPLLSSQNKSQTRGLLYYGLSVASYSLSNFIMKLFPLWCPSTYNFYSFIIIRGILLALIGYYILKTHNEKILHIHQINNKFWFILRLVSNYFILVFLSLSFKYLRAATTATIFSINPIVAVLLAVVILKEKFYLKYLVFNLIGILSCFMMIMNDEKYQDSKAEADKNLLEPKEDALEIFMGFFYGILAMISMALIVVTTKILIIEKIDFKNQIFYIGLTNSVFALIFGFFSLEFYMDGLLIFLILFSGVTYYLGLLFLNLGLELVDAAKTSPLAYIGIVINFLLGAVMIGEPVFFTDILGSLIIIICNVCYSKMK